jgi:hypothetical protein
LLRLEDKDLLQIDATVIAGVLVLSTVGALKLNITVIAWVASTVTWFSFSAFLILSHILKPDASTDGHKTKLHEEEVLIRKFSIGSMAAETAARRDLYENSIESIIFTYTDLK